VRPGDVDRKRQLEAVLDRRKSEIDRLLAEYGVPIVSP
jgi:hypothetical protein